MGKNYRIECDSEFKKYPERLLRRPSTVTMKKDGWSRTRIIDKVNGKKPLKDGWSKKANAKAKVKPSSTQQVETIDQKKKEEQHQCQHQPPQMQPAQLMERPELNLGSILQYADRLKRHDPTLRLENTSGGRGRVDMPQPASISHDLWERYFQPNHSPAHRQMHNNYGLRGSRAFSSV